MGSEQRGRLLVLRSDDVEVTVLPSVGARLHRLRLFGRDLLRTPDDPSAHEREPFSWGAYTMAPWCNRLDARPTTVLGRTVDLPSNFPDGTAIHGQAYARPWRQVDDGVFHMGGGGDGWPWPYDVTMAIVPGPSSLDVSYRLRNLADEPMPAGVGLHPWFVTPVRVAVPSGHVYRSNVAPSSRPEAVAPPYDLREATIPADGVDATWVAPDQPTRLAWPELAVTATVTTKPASPVVVAARPEGIDAVAVEPQTHAPGALGRLLNGDPGAPAVLGPGERLHLMCAFRFERSGTPPAAGVTNAGRRLGTGPGRQVVDWSDVVGTAEVATRLRVRRNTVRSWTVRGHLPEADAVVSDTPLWSWQRTIAPWAKELGYMDG